MLQSLCSSAGFEIVANDYKLRKTINKKEDIDVDRVFVQGKFKKTTKECK